MAAPETSHAAGSRQARHLPLVLDGAESGGRLPVLVWDLRPGCTVVSTASVGGGLGERGWIVNAQVGEDYSRTDLGAHVAELAAAAGVARGPEGAGTGVDGAGVDGAEVGVGMLTAADVGDHVVVEREGVAVVATVGVRIPTWAAGPGTDGDPPLTPADAAAILSGHSGTAVAGDRRRWPPPPPATRSDRSRAGEPAGPLGTNPPRGAGVERVAPPGTINLVCFVAETFDAGALVNLVTTATEAKAQAMWSLGLPGTGTASDAVAVVSASLDLASDPSTDPPTGTPTGTPTDQPAGTPSSEAESDHRPDGTDGSPDVEGTRAGEPGGAGAAHQRFGGPRSPVGALLADAVHEAVTEGCLRSLRRIAAGTAVRRAGSAVLVVGGARSGKSEVAESLTLEAREDPPAPSLEPEGAAAADDVASRGPLPVYLATYQPSPGEGSGSGSDTDMDGRIERHLRRRRGAFETVELRGDDLPGLLDSIGPAPVLVESLGTWVSLFVGRDRIDRQSAGQGTDEPVADARGADTRGADDRGPGDTSGSGDGSDPSEVAPPGFDEALADLVGVVSRRSSLGYDTVLVCEEVGWGVHPSTEAGRRFRDMMGIAATAVGGVADRVLLVVAGRALDLPPPPMVPAER